MAESIDRASGLSSSLFSENVYRVNKMDPDGRSSQENFQDTLDRKEDEESEEEESDEKSKGQPDSESILIEDQVILSSKVKPSDAPDATPGHETTDMLSKDTFEHAVKPSGIPLSVDAIPAASKKPESKESAGPDSKSHVNVVA